LPRSLLVFGHGHARERVLSNEAVVSQRWRLCVRTNCGGQKHQTTRVKALIIIGVKSKASTFERYLLLASRNSAIKSLDGARDGSSETWCCQREECPSESSSFGNAIRSKRKYSGERIPFVLLWRTPFPLKRSTAVKEFHSSCFGERRSLEGTKHSSERNERPS